MLNSVVLIVSFAVLANSAPPQPKAVAIVPEDCIRCMCEATSLCDFDTGCLNGFCGPFRISKGFWLDAGKFVVIGDDKKNPQGA